MISPSLIPARRFAGPRSFRLVAGLLAGTGAAAHGAAPDRSMPPPEVLATMFQVPGLPSQPEKIEWSRLPSYRGRTSVVARGVKGESAFMHHPQIVAFDGRFFAKWNDGYVGEDFAGQRIRYATSRDGLQWSEPIDLTGRHPRRRYTACGFWLRDGGMFALAALRDASDAGKSGEEPVLLAFPWDATVGRFGERTVIAKDFFAGNIPQRAPDGDWLILGKGGVGSWGPMKSAKGGVKALDDWTIRDLPGAGKLEEAEWYALPNGHLVAHFRTRTPKRLMRCYSVDSGVTWTEPVVTNFPEAGARHHGLRLSNGLYALLVNPNPSSRIPFSIALSRDGLAYERIANVRAEVTRARHEGRAKSAGYHYMRGFEHAGQLYTIYSVNKEDIEVTIVPLAELAAQFR
ncbi:MAG: exo-alpha-sialidase [Opitutaceae bacterium]|nr:exo-alpha-sialidase [Opitutaceae bacterium]